MKITSKSIHTEENQGVIVLQTAGTERFRLTGEGHAIFSASATDQSGLSMRGLTGGTVAITAASAATAGSTSALSAFQIAHSLGQTPTLFDAKAGGTNARNAELLGTFVTADSTYVYVTTTTSVTASNVYTFQWWAAP